MSIGRVRMEGGGQTQENQVRIFGEGEDSERVCRSQGEARHTVETAEKLEMILSRKPHGTLSTCG